MKSDSSCKLCKRHLVTDIVCELGTGDRTAEIMIVFEQPSNLNMGFVGDRARLELQQYLIEAKVIDHDSDNVFITHAVACRDPSGKAPTKSEIVKCNKWLKYQIARVKPKFILSVGAVSLEALTGEKGIKKKRGKPIIYEGAVLLPIFGTNIISHDPSMAEVIARDLTLFKQCIDFGGIPESEELNFHVVDTWDKVEEMLADLTGTVAGDLETTRLYPFTTAWDELIWNGEASDNLLLLHKATHGNIEPPRIVSMQWGTKTAQWVVPMENGGIWTRKELEAIVKRVDKALKKCYLVGHNWKFDALWMRCRFGVVWKADFDTMLAHYMHDENERHGLKQLAIKYCEAVDWDIGGEEKREWSLKNAKYAAHDVFYTRKLKFILSDLLADDPQVSKVFRKIMMPTQGLFIDSEFHGVKVDLDKMDDAEDYLRGEVTNAQDRLRKWEPKPKLELKGKAKGKPIEFNWGSPKQVGDLLFNELDIIPVEFTKTGSPSTSESALNQMDHPCVGDLLKYRGAKQQLSFFIDGWKPYLTPDGCLHPSFKIHGTVTGRLSCENPNLQQVPRDPRIRSLIIAIDGWDMNDCDLSQIELRIAAHAANEKNMIMAFHKGIDIHWLTALREIERGAGLKKEIEQTVKAYYRAERPSDEIPKRYGDMVKCLLEEIGPDKAAGYLATWKEFRKKAKAINFGYLYGMWWKKFKIYARDNYGVEINDKQAEASRKAFFENYPELVDWHKGQKRFVRLNGYVRSLSGRKRRLPDALATKDSPKRQQAERQAINSPIQSFGNELNLMAAIQLSEEYGLDVCRIVGTIHDAVLFMTRRDMTLEIHRRMMEIMSSPSLLMDFNIDLKVPVLADGNIGPWSKGIKIDKFQELVNQGMM